MVVGIALVSAAVFRLRLLESATSNELGIASSHMPTSSQSDLSVSADGLQNGLLEVLAPGEPVNEIECHRRSLKPLSTIINRPNAVGFRKLIHECLNKRIRHSAGIASICGLDKSENWSLLRLAYSLLGGFRLGRLP